MSEQDPLLPSHNPNDDARAQAEPEVEQSRITVWKSKTAEALESPPLHYTVIALVVVDSACVLADLGYTVLSSDCEPPEGPDAPVWLNVLSYISLVITLLFVIELPVTLWALGPKFYNPFGEVLHGGLHLFDAVIILTTFVLEVILRGKERELASLLIILRLWRLVKLVGGIAVGAGDIQEESAKMLKDTRDELEEVTKTIEQLRTENTGLRERITWLESQDSSV